MDKGNAKISTARLRAGIIIWILSWMPLPTLVVHLLHDSGHLQNDKATSLAYAVLWGTQIIIGLCGLLLAGKETLTLAKVDGKRGLPRNLWRIVIHGQMPDNKVKAGT